MFTIVEQTEIETTPREPWATPEQAAAWYPVTSPPIPSGPTQMSTQMSTEMSNKASRIDPGSELLTFTNEPISTPGTTLLAVFACLAGLITIAGSMLQILTIRSDAAIPQYLGDYTISDLDGVGTNFQIAWLIAGTLMLLGGLLVVQHTAVRFGAGLAGGAGAIIVPLVAFAGFGTNSLTDRALQQAQYVASVGEGGTQFEFTLHVGFFTLFVAAAFGAATLVLAIGFARDDGRVPLTTWLCVAGALGCVVAGAGQLIPGVGARFADNFSNPYSVGAFVVARLAMIAMMVVVGVLGFLLANRFGLGLALGAVSVYTWQWASSLYEWGNLPLPPAIFNPGGDGKPHIVTTLGVVIALVCAARLAMIARRADTPA
ncbi:MAG: hypothetical protein ABIR32_14355 [Ilumatobacteraceae bacterium]